MAENSKIEWTDHTINFWWGCTKVSPACANCYAEALDARFHVRTHAQTGNWEGFSLGVHGKGAHWGMGAPRFLREARATQEALRYERRAVKEERRFRVFTNSMSDFFEDRRDLDRARLEALDTIRKTPHLDWMILTKRPEKIIDILRLVQTHALSPIYLFDTNDALADWLGWWISGKAPANVWLGTSVEDQERAVLRIPALRAVPAAIRFLSMEPLLSPVDLSIPYLSAACGGSYPFPMLGHELRTKLVDVVDWVIVGGESGPHSRPMHPDWARGLRDQCAAVGVPFLFKQWGEWAPIDQPWVQDNPTRLGHNEQWLNSAGGQGFHGEEVWRMRNCGKKTAGRLLDGVEHNGMPGVQG